MCIDGWLDPTSDEQARSGFANSSGGQITDQQLAKVSWRDLRT